MFVYVKFTLEFRLVYSITQDLPDEPVFCCKIEAVNEPLVAVPQKEPPNINPP